MTLSTESLARASARRPWLTLGLWVAALVVAIAAVVLLLDLTTSGEVTSNPESEQGYAAIGRHFPPDPEEEFVVEPAMIRHRHTLTPYLGRRLAGVVEATYLRGQLVYSRNQPDPPASGHLLSSVRA